MSQPPPTVQALLFSLLIILFGTTQADERGDFFERQIRPILVEQCSGCHGAKKQNGGLRVDSLEALLHGGDTGPALKPGKPRESLLIHAIRRSEELAMPPEKPLPKRQVDALQRWIESGAYWPKKMATIPSKQDRSAEDHWAFQPIKDPKPPENESDWIRTPIDSFVLQRLNQNQLEPAPKADRRTLLRRATYALTGLPPTSTEVSDFMADQRSNAWELVIDRLLQSPHYGEQWARHWLDVARYADTKGYVYAREERFWIHAWAYRDWVIGALNDDMPYDRFLMLQIAADQVQDRQQADLAAMGFLTLGRRFLGVTPDIIDDRIDVVCRGTMGLTVACARCHDHKYDPIPTADYYSLYGVFGSCSEKVESLGEAPADDKEFIEELAKRQSTLTTNRTKRCNEASDRIRNRVRDYLVAQTELHKYPRAGFDQVIVADDIHPRVVYRWNAWLYDAKRRRDPVFRAWHEFERLPVDSFADEAIAVTAELSTLTASELNPLVAALFSSPPKAFADVVNRYGVLLSETNTRWKEALTGAKSDSMPVPTSLPDPAAEQIRQVLYSPGSPCVIPDEHVSNTELLFTSAVLNELWKQQGEVDRWLIQSKHNTPRAVTLVDRRSPVEPRIFVRGSATNPGAPVPRRFLSLFGKRSNRPFQNGSGRLELAQAIVDPANPLTARVIVNRVWAHLFGRGLVSTPSDFGLRAERPSHPELLDWLTNRFIKEGWSLKKLHRLILTSAVFQQASGGLNESVVQHAQQIDPENRLLWRITPHRLTFEEYRDSLLQTSGVLDSSAGGKPFDLFKKEDPVNRRTVYGLIDRQYLPATLRTFDFANPDLHIAARSETTVPQQALFFLNHEMVLRQVRILAKKSALNTSPEERIAYLFRQILQRSPTQQETLDAERLITSTTKETLHKVRLTAADWSYGYGEVVEDSHHVRDFQPAPHFTGTAWQGGPDWPDKKLGWVNLTAVGGHPGNTRKHACVRRWTAPRDITVRINSKLIHEPTAGDGIRAFVLASGNRELNSVRIHSKSAELNTQSLTLMKNDIIDFVVDIDKVLNSDQFLWHISITDLGTRVEDHSDWDSKKDFPRTRVKQLTPWEQLAHVLLCTNEFMFVD